METENGDDKLGKVNKWRVIPKSVRIKISFEMLEHGWINLLIDLSNLRLKLWLSSIFDPMPDILAFYRELVMGASYAKLVIDEEGIFKIIEATRRDDDADLYVMNIISRGMPEYTGDDEYEVIKTISMTKFLDELKQALTDLAEKNPDKV